MVTLKPGNEKPVTPHASDTEAGPTAPLLLFAVPSMEALMDGMQDDRGFEVFHNGKPIVDLACHDGSKARDALRQCLAGRPFDIASH